MANRSILWTAAAAFTLMAVQFGALRFASSPAVVRVILPLTIAGVPLALWPLRGKVGVWIMFVGLAANLAVILANGGLMPIERRSVDAALGAERAQRYHAGEWIAGSKDRLVAEGRGRAVSLGDSIVVRVGAGGFVASPGDVVVWAGLLTLAIEGSVAWQRRESRRARSLAQTGGDGTAGERAEGGAATSSWRAAPPPT